MNYRRALANALPPALSHDPWAEPRCQCGICDVVREMSVTFIQSCADIAVMEGKASYMNAPSLIAEAYVIANEVLEMRDNATG